ncbi:MAG: ATP synthase F0 subunit B [Acidobacteria bacterium]|nr:ATP synthase F0 subunit B [Acidobacteriota bacterium]
MNGMTVYAFAGSVLSIDGSFLFIFFSIILLIFILNRTLFKPINQILDERERLGAGRMAEARQMLVQYEERLAGYEDQIRAARAEAYQHLETQRKQSLVARQEMVVQMRAETSEQVQAARREIEKQVAGAKQNLESEARAMAATISSRLLNRPVSSGGN